MAVDDIFDDEDQEQDDDLNYDGLEPEDDDDDAYGDDFTGGLQQPSAEYSVNFDQPPTRPPTNQDDHDEAPGQQDDDPPAAAAATGTTMAEETEDPDSRNDQEPLPALQLEKAEVLALRKEREELLAEVSTLRDRESERRSTRSARSELSVSQMHDQLFEASKKLVAEGEKNAKLSQKLLTLKDDMERLKSDADAARWTLVEKISAGARRKGDGDAYANVTLTQLLQLREKAIDAQIDEEIRVAVASATDRPPTRQSSASSKKSNTQEEEAPAGTAAVVMNVEAENAKLRQRIRKLEDDKQQLRNDLKRANGAADDVRMLKAKLSDMLHRREIEKDLKARAEDLAAVSQRKVAALSDHVEKLMVHLKHEVSAKVGTQDQLRRSEREIDHLKQRNAGLLKRNNAREKFLLELKEGSKILEDQLRLMDRRYLELRSKLDWTRHHANREVKKFKHTASTLRAKWALATNAQAGLLDNVQLPPASKPSTAAGPLVGGPTTSDDRAASAPVFNAKHHKVARFASPQDPHR